MYKKLLSRELDIANNNILLQNEHHEEINYKDKVCVKPWGHEFLIFKNTKIAIWYVSIKKGGETSLHCHFKKDTLLITLSGVAKIKLLDDEVIALNILETMFIPRYKFHSLASFSDQTIIMEIEIFSNELNFSDKNDLLRIEDPFKREKTGYEKSVKIETTSLDKWDYFYLDNKFYKSINVSGTTITTHKIQNNNFTVLNKDNINILLEGEVFFNNNYLREGSLITNVENMYTFSKNITILTLNNLNKSEDAKIIYNIDHLKVVLQALKSKKITLTSGCFDILHVGHLHSLKVAKSLGDVLIVCLSNDEQIKKLKGKNRPINNYEDRINLFKTITYVDYVVLYDEEDIIKEETLDKIIHIINPYYWVKGSDYNIDDIRAKHPSLQNIYLIDNIINKSSTNIINKIGSLK
jgi:rfaE bifunctional protein nucleotidyltransferase chain/domain